MKKMFIAALMLLFANVCIAQEKTNQAPLVIKAQGSFFAGGTIVKAGGVYDRHDQTNPKGQTLHGDHAYVWYQTPVGADSYPMVFLHGAGQSGKTWETTTSWTSHAVDELAMLRFLPQFKPSPKTSIGLKTSEWGIGQVFTKVVNFLAILPVSNSSSAKLRPTQAITIRR